MMASAALYIWRSTFSAIDTSFAPKKFILDLDRRTCSEIAKILA
jgi:hypothetical protein